MSRFLLVAICLLVVLTLSVVGALKGWEVAVLSVLAVLVPLAATSRRGRKRS